MKQYSGLEKVVGFIAVVQLILILAQLRGDIDWPIGWLFAPVWFPILMILIFVVAIGYLIDRLGETPHGQNGD